MTSISNTFVSIDSPQVALAFKYIKKKHLHTKTKYLTSYRRKDKFRVPDCHKEQERIKKISLRLISQAKNTKLILF